MRLPTTVAGFGGVVCINRRGSMEAVRDRDQLLIAAEPPAKGNWERSFILGLA